LSQARYASIASALSNPKASNLSIASFSSCVTETYCGGGQGGTNIDDLNALRNQPHFRDLRQFVRQNPSLLQPLLQQIGTQNPGLLELINSNQATFMRLLQEPDEGDESNPNIPPPQYVSVTQEDKEAIDRLEALGFERAHAIEAYLACDRNEEMAANYLFDHMNDEEN
jgi:UV excision repair protein RAD23